MSFPTAAELNLWDYEVPEGTALSVIPPAQEYMWDPFWWDQAGRDPIDQWFIFRKEAGEERTAKLRKVVEEYPRYGPKIYEKCAREGRPDIIKELLALGVSMDIEAAKRDTRASKGDPDDTPMAKMEPAILEAAYNGHFECVKVLVEEAGVDVSFKHTDGTTVITNAAVRGHTQIVEWLLQRGAVISLESQNLNDVEAAIRSGDMELARLVLNNEQTVAKKYKLESSTILQAAMSGNAEMVKLVLEYADFPPVPLPGTGDGIEVDLPKLSDELETALLGCLPSAVKNGTPDMVRLILPYLTPRLPDGSFKRLELDESNQAYILNAMADAISDGRDDATLFELVWETLLCLPREQLEAASQETKDLWHERLHRRLIDASDAGCPKIVQLLCERYGADVNHISHKYFTTPLSRASGAGQSSVPGRLAVTKYLLEQPGIDIHLATGEYSNGPTAIALGVREGNAAEALNQKQVPGQAEIVRLILEHGGPVEDIDPQLAEVVSRLGEDEIISMWLVMGGGEARFPVWLLSQEMLDKETADGRVLSKMELAFDKAGLSKVISNLQVRKRDPVLAANDPRKRPLDHTEVKSARNVAKHMSTATRRHVESITFGE